MHGGTTGVRRYGVLAAIALTAGLGASGEIDGLAAGMLAAPFDAVRPAQPATRTAASASAAAPRSLAAATAVRATAAEPGNLLPNGSFETGLTGWDGFNARLTRVRGGSDGVWAARVRRQRDAYYSIYTPRRPVQATVAGATYTASAWVRTDVAGRDREVCLRIREWAGGSVAGSASTCFQPNGQWRLLGPLAYTALKSGRQLDVYVYAEGRKHEWFEVDDVSLRRGPLPDTTPPAVALTAPAEGAVVGGTVPLAATASDDRGVERVDFLADGAVVAVDSSAPYEGSWDSTGRPDGPVTLTARAVDTSGNVRTSAPRQVRVENLAPETTLVSGPSGTVRSSSGVFTFSSPEPGATFECSLDGAAFAACASPHTVSVANRGHSFQVRARDLAGKLDESPAAGSWWADALLLDGSFEAEQAGWSPTYTIAAWHAYGGTVSRVPGGVAGAFAARVVADGSDESVSLYTAPKPIDATLAGVTYVAGGKVRTDGAGATVCLRVREFNALLAVVGSAQRCVVAGTAWQSFAPLSYLPAAPGNQLEVDAYQGVAAPGDSFELDDLTLDDGGASVGPTIPAPADGSVLLAAGDIASCQESGDEWTARLLDGIEGTVAAAGDTAYDNGTAAEFASCYEPTWGRHKARTRPAVGDHEYGTPDAAGYFGYWGGAAGPAGLGYYSYELGDWHVVVLNAVCNRVPGGCGAGSPQEQWLRADLASHQSTCTLAYMHEPRFSSGAIHGSHASMQPFWQALYDYGADVVLGGDDHVYERFAPQTPGGLLDVTRGIRQFVVGTGGNLHYPFGAPAPNSEARNNDAFGVLRLVLRGSAYDWQFVPQSGRTFTDAGTTACSPRDTTAPTVALTAPADGSTVGGTVTLAADAADDRAIEQVDFLVDGVVVGTDRTAPYSVAWDSTTTSATTATITARARDTGANETTSASRTVTLDNVPPDTTIDSGPSDPSASTSATFTFSAGEPGVSFSCSLDGAAFSACSSPTTVSGLDNGSHTFRVAARDAAGSVDPTPAERTWTVDAPNLMVNGGFEAGLGNWRPNSRATLSLVSPGYAGAQAARVSWVSGTDFSIFPSPRPVLSTDAGRTYVARAWVRSQTPGRRLCLYLREWSGTGSAQVRIGESRMCIPASSADWQQFPAVRLAAVGGYQLEIVVAEDGALPGDSFDVDEITLR